MYQLYINMENPRIVLTNIVNLEFKNTGRGLVLTSGLVMENRRFPALGKNNIMTSSFDVDFEFKS